MFASEIRPTLLCWAAILGAFAAAALALMHADALSAPASRDQGKSFHAGACVRSRLFRWRMFLKPPQTPASAI